jgi:hypothetical protein
MTLYNVYCDESAHLPANHQPVMVLGATQCPLKETRHISDTLRSIKSEHGLARNFEMKWTKVSPAQLDFYTEVIDFFFDEEALRFRALVIADKTKLDHASFSQDHDSWYYKMYYSMMKAIISPMDRFRIYLDIKDTRSTDKIQKLHKVLCNTLYDFDHAIIERVQTVRSHEIELLQLTDLLMGAVRYANTAATGSSAKQALVKQVQTRSGYTLSRSTLLKEEKLNLFFWRSKETGI